MLRVVWIALLLLLAGNQAFAAQATVTDGDTLMLGRVPYRLDGIDAPETDQLCLNAHGQKWECGKEARDQLVKFISKREVRCDDKGSDSAFRFRRIGVCWVEGEKTSLNQWLVKAGWALRFEPYAKGRFKDDEESAKMKGDGLWKGCFVRPRDFRYHRSEKAELLGQSCEKEASPKEIIFPRHPAMPPDCPIKGKLAWRAHFTGHRGIYHLEGCRSYGRLANPDRWFCSEQEALAEGFRRAFTCSRK